MKNLPQPVSQAPPPALVQRSGSVVGGIGGAIADGIMWGTGSAIGHRAVDAVLGPRTIHHETVSSAPPAEAFPAASAGGSTSMGSDSCMVHSKAFQDCINNYGSDISKCQFYLDMLNECRRGSTLSA